MQRDSEEERLGSGGLSLAARQRLNMSAEAAGAIEWLILTGELRGGDRLRQEQIASMLGMSVTPVREAFVRLATDGWVTFRRHRGVTVNAMTRERIMEHCDLIEILMEYVIRRAVDRRSAIALAKLNAETQRLEESTDPEEILAAFEEINLAIVDMADAPRAAALLHNVSLVALRVTQHLPEVVGIFQRVGRRMTDAMAAGDAVEVVDAHRSLTRAYRGHLVEWVEAQGVIPAT
jgi:DNA-binding GntR family transcriptional regulator